MNNFLLSQGVDSFQVTSLSLQTSDRGQWWATKWWPTSHWQHGHPILIPTSSVACGFQNRLPGDADGIIYNMTLKADSNTEDGWSLSQTHSPMHQRPLQHSLCQLYLLNAAAAGTVTNHKIAAPAADNTSLSEPVGEVYRFYLAYLKCIKVSGKCTLTHGIFLIFLPIRWQHCCKTCYLIYTRWHQCIEDKNVGNPQNLNITQIINSQHITVNYHYYKTAD